MIQANGVTLRLGKKALFEDVSIKFTEGNCYGIIGANGAGKSTFLRILSGQLETTSGNVSISEGQRLSFLEQDHNKYDNQIVLDTVIQGNPRLFEIRAEKDALYAKEDFSDEEDCFEITTDPDDFSAVREELEKLGYEFASAELEMVPDTYVKLEDEDTASKMQKMLDMFEDNDDIQNVWHNWEEA